jgi:chaperonin cofactor prefoldin
MSIQGLDIVAVYGGALLILVGRPGVVTFYQARRLLRQCRHWEKLKTKVGELTRAEVEGLPDPTRHVLECVLTDRPGMGRPGSAAGALEHLAAAVNGPLRRLRSLSYFAVLLGLFGTVFILAYSFWGMQDIHSLKPELLSHIYTINAIAVLAAAFFYFLFMRFRWRGDHLLLTASATLGKLYNEVPDNVDPLLVAALESVAQRFKEWAEESYAQHRQKTEDLVHEMRALGEAIKDMVQQMVAARHTEEEGIIPLLRSQDEKVELLSQRLDERFRELAQPIRETLPLIAQWQQRIEELGGVVLALREADLPAQTATLARTVETLGDAVRELPERVENQFRGIKKVIGTGLQEAVRQGWRETLAESFEDLSSRLSAMVSTQKQVGETLDRLPQELGRTFQDTVSAVWQQTIQPASNTLMQSLSRSLEPLGEAVRPLVEGDMPGKLRALGDTLSRLETMPQAVATVLGERIHDFGEAFPLKAAQVWRELGLQELPDMARSLGVALEKLNLTFQVWKEGQQQLVKAMETSGSELIARLETWGGKLMEQADLRITTFQEFQEKIMASLSRLEEALKERRELPTIVSPPTPGRKRSFWDRVLRKS